MWRRLDLNINDYLELVKKIDNDIYIFGAGRAACIVHEIVKNENKHVCSFLVSDAAQNKKMLYDKKVIQADSEEIRKDITVLIAVIEHGQKKIHSYLDSLGYLNIIDTPEGLLDCDPWEYKRTRTPIIEVTARIGCAVNCKYCPQKLLVKRYYDGRPDRKGVMALSDYKRYLDKCPDNTIVDFSGFVEPFLVDESIDMMEYTNINHHEMTLFTTLRGLTVESAKRVLEMPFQYVCLHTPDKDGYANIPMTDEYFKVLEMFMDAKKENRDPFIDVANCQSEPHPEIVKRVRGRLKIYCEMSDRAGNLDEEDPVLTHVNTKGNIYCSRAFGLNHNVLLPDGSLVLCCNDFGLVNILGNLNTQTYDEIMHGEPMRNIKRAMHINIEEELICRKCMFAKKIEED